MEVVLAPAQHDGLHAAFGPNPYGGIGGDGRFSSSLSSLGGDRFCGYSTTTTVTASSRFGNSCPGLWLSSPSPRAASQSRGSSDSGSVVDDGDEDAASAVAERRLRLARLALQYQEVVNRFELCLSYLADASNEAAALRRENDELRVANEDLARRISVAGGKLVDEFSRLRLAEEHTTPPPPPPPPLPLPAAPVILKSISVRSPGYLKMNQNSKHRASKTTKGSQRVLVGMDGGVKGEEEKNLNAGLQFAHGIGELRPVIRHPRYKTEVCRMVLAGVVCPYGHRCHFRHSITPADLFLPRP